MEHRLAAVAPLLLAVAVGLGPRGYPVGFTIAAAVGIAGALVAYRSLQIPPPAPALVLARHHH